MRAIILAAGSSQRLRPLTNEVPKTLLMLKDRTILQHIVEGCLRSGIREIFIVTGHGHERVRAECENLRIRHADCSFFQIHCPEYLKMGNVYSLYVARALFSDPFVLINSDLVFGHDILASLLACPADHALVIDDCKQLGLEEMKVTIANGLITGISKELDPKKAHGEYIGMLKFSPSIRGPLERALAYFVENAPNKYYEDALSHMIQEGCALHPLSSGNLPAMEIDTFEDLALAKKNSDLWA